MIMPSGRFSKRRGITCMCGRRTTFKTSALANKLKVALETKHPQRVYTVYSCKGSRTGVVVYHIKETKRVVDLKEFDTFGN